MPRHDILPDNDGRGQRRGVPTASENAYHSPG
jgi:hypothetical protein